MVVEQVASAHLLVVDDEEELRELLAEFFGRQGWRVSTARDAAAARTAMRIDRPDVAVLDVHMPGEDGLSLMRWMHAHCPGVGIVMLTTAAETLAPALRPGGDADDWLPKPFELRELLARTRRLLARRNRAATDETEPPERRSPPETPPS